MVLQKGGNAVQCFIFGFWSFFGGHLGEGAQLPPPLPPPPFSSPLLAPPGGVASKGEEKKGEGGGEGAAELWGTGLCWSAPHIKVPATVSSPYCISPLHHSPQYSTSMQTVFKHYPGPLGGHRGGPLGDCQTLWFVYGLATFLVLPQY